MSVRVATCRKCEMDVMLDDVVGVRDFEKSRRLTWLCPDCGTRDSFTYSFREYRRLIGKEVEIVEPEEDSIVDPQFVGCMVQGFRIELDTLNEDFNIILAGWDYEDRYRRDLIPLEDGKYVSLGYERLGDV